MENNQLVFNAIVALNENRVTKHMTEAMIANESGVAIADVQACIKALMLEGRIKRFRIDVSKRRRQYYYTPCYTPEKAVTSE